MQAELTLLALVLTTCVAITIDPYDTAHILYRGRFALTDPQSHVVQYDWSGVSFAVRFTNTTKLPLLLQQDVGNLYNVYIFTPNAEPRTSVIKATKDKAMKKYDLGHTVPLDPAKEYTLEIEKRTEASFGTVRFSGFEFSEHVQLLEPEPSKKLKMQFVGDSLTCGYGNEGTAPCHFSADTENFHMSYAAIAARILDAQYHVTSWSGKGMIRNYGDKEQLSARPMPFYFNRTVATNDKAIWNFTTYVPDIVVINLGTNDFSTKPHPTEEQYSKGYNTFLDRLKQYYGPQVRIFCMSGPSKIPYTPQIVAARKDPTITFADVQGVLKKKEDWGCDGHPSVKGDTIMGTILADIIKKGL
jgi:lysophospholipase L1-like esterase